MILQRRDLIVQQCYPEDEKSWYVQEIHLLDMGRFRTEQEAIEHKEFLQSPTST